MAALPLALQGRHRGNMKRIGIPRIDRSNPRAQGLLFYAFDTGMGVVIDLVSGRLGTRTPSATKAGNGVSPFGQGVLWNNSDGISWPASAAVKAATAAGGYTFACGVVPTSASMPQFSTPFARTANNNASGAINWGFLTSDTLDNVYSTIDSGGTTTTVGSLTTGGLPVGRLSSLATTVTAAGLGSFFVSGKANGTTSALVPASINTLDNIIMSGISAAGVSLPWTGFVFYGAFWSRALSAAEILAQHLDPYSFLIFPDDGVLGLLANLLSLFSYRRRNATLLRR